MVCYSVTIWNSDYKVQIWNGDLACLCSMYYGLKSGADFEWLKQEPKQDNCQNKMADHLKTRPKLWQKNDHLNIGQYGFQMVTV